MPKTYEDFLASKALTVPDAGFQINPSEINPNLFPFQRDLVQWGLKKGRAGIFTTTGTGKSRISLAWAEKAADRVLLLAPLAVAQQTIEEGEKIGIRVTYARNMMQSPRKGITITNYEMFLNGHFDVSQYGAISLDESSILASYTGATKQKLIADCASVPMRLSLTATPAPNDSVELCNQAHFLGVMQPRDMLTIFFTTKGVGVMDGRFRLKTHAKEAFYQWLSSWAMSLLYPSDLGYSDEGYILPELKIESVIVPSDYVPDGQLFYTRLNGIQERTAARRSSVEARVQATVDLVRAQSNEQWLLWCGLNAESEMLTKALGKEAVEVRGPDSPESKAERLSKFAHGQIKYLVTKPSIAGFGLNFQSCARMAFVGLGDSYQAYFQAMKRCHRFGQKRDVEAYIVLSEAEQDIYDNVLRKERVNLELMRELIRNVGKYEQSEIHGLGRQQTYNPQIPILLPDWLKTVIHQEIGDNN